MKRRLTIARSLVNKPRPAPARRADHGPRPAGPAPAVGPAVPAQADRRHAGDHHALHGRGRAALRPAGRDGQGRDRRRGLAAALIQQHATREVTELRFGLADEDDDHSTRWPRRSPTWASASRCCPTALLVYSDDGDEVRAPRSHERGLQPGRRAGPPVHARGRVPAPHRPDAGRLTSSLTVCRSPRELGRQVDYWVTVYRRTWKGTAISSFVAPLFYVVAMGVLLGGFIEGDPAELEGATSYLAFLVPGLVAAHAMQTAVGETTYPVMAHDQVAAHLRLDAGHAAAGPRPRATRTLALRHVPGGDRPARCSCWWWLPFGDLRDLVGRAARVRLAGARRYGVRVGGLRVLDAARRRPRASACCSGSGCSRCSCSPARSSRSTNLGDVGRLARPADAAVARREPVADVHARPRRLELGRRERRCAASPSRCSACAGRSRGLHEAAGVLMATTRRLEDRSLTSPSADLVLAAHRRRAPSGCSCCATTSSTATPGSCSSPGSSSRSSTCCRSASASASSSTASTFNGRADRLRVVRGARHARRVGVQRRADRHDVQRVLQAEVRPSSTTRCSPPRCRRRDIARGEIVWGQLRGGAYAAVFVARDGR